MRRKGGSPKKTRNIVIKHFAIYRGSTLFRPYTKTNYVYTPDVNLLKMADTNVVSSVRKLHTSPYLEFKVTKHLIPNVFNFAKSN